MLELPTLTLNWPLVVLLAGWALRIRSQKKPAFDGVGSPDFGDGVADAGHVLVGIETLPRAAGFEAAWVEHEGRFAAAQPPKDGICATPFLNRPL